MKSFSGILLLLMAGLVSILVYEIRFGTVNVGQTTATGSSQPSPIVSAAVPTFALPTLDNYAESVERPLFAHDRRPHQSAPVPEQPPNQRPVRQADPSRFVLSAVIMEGNTRVALLRDPTNGTLTRLKEGSSIGGWSLNEVRADSVVLSNGSTTQEVQLRRFEPPPPPRPKRRKARIAANIDEATSANSDRKEQRPKRRNQAQTQQGRTDDATGVVSQ